MKNYGIKSELIRSLTKIADDYDEKYMKIKFDLDDDLPLNKTKICSMIIFVFHENNKYYPQYYQHKLRII